jgi:signal transduction histidine kinase
MKPTGEGMEGGSVSNKTVIEAHQNPMGDRALIGRGSGRDQEQSEHQEREWLASLGTMAAVFAHELANPLAGISCSLEFVEGELKNGPIDNSSVISVVQSAMREVDRLSSLLHEFRSLAPRQNLDLKPIVLAETIEEVLACQRTHYEAAGINRQARV